MNSVKLAEELGTAVWKARNPDAIDRLVVDDFVITTGGVDIVTKDRCIPQRWKMALLTWIAVWPVSMLVPAILKPVLGPNFPQVRAEDSLPPASSSSSTGSPCFTSQGRAQLLYPKK